MDENTMKRQFRQYEIAIEHLQNTSSIIKNSDIHLMALSTVLEHQATILQLGMDILQELKEGGKHGKD